MVPLLTTTLLCFVIGLSSGDRLDDEYDKLSAEITQLMKRDGKGSWHVGYEKVTIGDDVICTMVGGLGKQFPFPYSSRQSCDRNEIDNRFNIKKRRWEGFILDEGKCLRVYGHADTNPFVFDTHKKCDDQRRLFHEVEKDFPNETKNKENRRKRAVYTYTFTELDTESMTFGKTAFDQVEPNITKHNVPTANPLISFAEHMWMTSHPYDRWTVITYLTQNTVRQYLDVNHYNSVKNGILPRLKNFITQYNAMSDSSEYKLMNIRRLSAVLNKTERLWMQRVEPLATIGSFIVMSVLKYMTELELLRVCTISPHAVTTGDNIDTRKLMYDTRQKFIETQMRYINYLSHVIFDVAHEWREGFFSNTTTELDLQIVPAPTDCLEEPRGLTYSGSVAVTEHGVACQNWTNDSEDPNRNYCRNDDHDSRPWCYISKPNWQYCNIPPCIIRGVWCRYTFEDDYNERTITGECLCSMVPEKLKEFKKDLGFNYFRFIGLFEGTLKSFVEWFQYMSHEFIDPANCRDQRTDYRGDRDVTVSGKLCQSWNVQYPHEHSPHHLTHGCRNPDGDPDGPWCYTGENGAGRETCGIPLCSVDVGLDCPFRGGCGWQFDITKMHEWVVSSSRVLDHTARSNGNHLLLRGSDMPGGGQARMYSPHMTGDGQERCFHFWYYMRESATGTLRVSIERDGWSVPLWTKRGNQGSMWQPAAVSILATGGYNIVIEGEFEENDSGEMAIGDVILNEDKCFREIRGLKTKLTSCINKAHNGFQYYGHQAVTESGKPCVQWPVVDAVDTGRPFDALVVNFNYCRRMNASDERPWCFTDRTYRNRGFCDIPDCNDSDWN